MKYEILVRYKYHNNDFKTRTKKSRKKKYHSNTCGNPQYDQSGDIFGNESTIFF